MTTTLGAEAGLGRREARARRTTYRSFSLSLGTVGIVTILVSAWGGIIPYVGPLFGYSADGSPSWEWNLTHSVLALVPGAIGVVMGFSLLAPVRSSTFGRRFSLAFAGTVLMACGAWFAVGPLAWPVITDVSHYFVLASPLRYLAYELGYALGPGLILVGCGAFVLGWAARHNQPLGAQSDPLLAAGNGAVPVAKPVREGAVDPVRERPVEPVREGPVEPVREGPVAGADRSQVTDY